MPAMPEGAQEGILRGLYRVRGPRNGGGGKPPVRLFGSGAILNEALKAQELLETRYNVSADVWSITSFKELYRDGVECDRWNRLNPEAEARTTWIAHCLGKDAEGIHVIASDYVKALPASISRWFPQAPVLLGTDGFGRSDSRAGPAAILRGRCSPHCSRRPRRTRRKWFRWKRPPSPRRSAISRSIPQAQTRRRCEVQ